MTFFDDIVITGMRAICKSYAKINLTLDILGKREDGYHNVKMIMQTVNLFDLIIIDKAQKGIRLKTNLNYLPTDSKNIAYKAARLFFDKSGISGGASILIHKNIPVAAGLAGGSGNGGMVLCALNKLYDMPFSESELIKMSASLGADVPYCIIGGTALAEGIGERLTPLSPLPEMTVLLVKPPIVVSTADIYKGFDMSGVHTRPDCDAMLDAIQCGDFNKLCNNLCNVMETVTAKKYPVINGIKAKLLKNGAKNAVMSGSGPTVFGIFENDELAKKSADSFFRQYRDVFLCRTLN